MPEDNEMRLIFYLAQLSLRERELQEPDIILTLLVDLPIVDFLLYRVVRDQPVYVRRLALAVPVHPTHRLGVMARVPRGIQHNNTICTHLKRESFTIF